MLKADQQAEILAKYYNDKQSIRSIAREFGINRETVRRVIKNRTVVLMPQRAKRGSLLDPYKEEIRLILEKDPRVPAPAVLNRLRVLGYMGGLTTINIYLRQEKLRPVRKREAFLRLEFQPGECAQVDWGEFGDVFGDGVKIHCFAMVLCYSRYMYLEFTRAEKFEDFIRCHENAFKFFGGVPRECWYDNLSSAVTDRMGSLVRFNSRFMSYMGHHYVRPHACNVARGNEKGRVEDLIKFIRMNFWAGRQFDSFDELVKQSILWRNQIANQREHRTTKRVVRLFFESNEKPYLISMNLVPYDTDEIYSRSVPPDFHIIYETNRYSVPWTLVGITVTVRVNQENIRIFYNEKLVTSHKRSYLKNKVFTTESHKAGILERKPGVSKESWQLSAVKSIGPKLEEYVDLLISGHRSLRLELSGILALATVYGNQNVNEAVGELLGRGIIGIEALENTLKRLHHPKERELYPKPMEFEDQKLNRIVPTVDLRKYDSLIFEQKDTGNGKEKQEG